MQTSNNTSAHSRPHDENAGGRISNESVAADGEGPRQEDHGCARPRKPFGTKHSRKQLGSFWNRLREAWRAFIRAFSLSLLAHALRGLRHPIGRGLHEPTKIALNHSRVVAFVRNLIHIIPFGFALFETVLNWNVCYVGTQLYGAAVYQIIAKAHEILIQASLTVIVFSAIRGELAYGEGLPFGFLFSGLQITQVSYLWSMELWGAMKAGSIDLSRRTVLLLLLIGSILLAATCGPASAVLLIPRLQQWSAGSTRIWVNATADYIWPTSVDGSVISEACSTVGTTPSSGCPASEWYALRDYLFATEVQYSTSPYTLALESCLIHGQISARNLFGGRYLANDTKTLLISSALTQQAVVSDALSVTGSLWFWSLSNLTANAGHGSPLSDQSSAIHRIVDGYKQPASKAACLPLEVDSEIASELVAFPLHPLADEQSLDARNLTSRIRRLGPYRVIQHPDWTYSQLLNAPGDVKGYRIKWMERPRATFIDSSIGVAILLPRSHTTITPRVLVCNIVATWDTSGLEVETTGLGLGTAENTVHKGAVLRSREPISESHVPPHTPGHGFPLFGDPINISESWARYLNPSVQNTNTTLFNILMQQPQFDLQKGETPERAVLQVASLALVMLTTNGLARTGWGSTLQGVVKRKGTQKEGLPDGDYWLSGRGDVFEVDPIKSRNWTSFRVGSSLEGYAYNTLTTPPKIAIAIMMVYCVLVLGHTIYSGITGVSSNCWDTIAEVTALAINSTPTAALRNTCAGISELHIFKLPVRILVSRDEEGEGEHLELVFGPVDEAKTKARTIKPNRTYGTLPSGCVGETKKDV